MTSGSRRAVIRGVLVAIAAANSGCAFYFKGGVHPHWVPTESGAGRRICKSLPEVYERDAPPEPYRSIGIIQVLSIAKVIVFGQVIMPDRMEIISALQKDACELGCDVLVERSLHHIARRSGRESDVPWSLAQFPGYSPPPMYDAPPPPDVDEFQFVCGVSIADSEGGQPAHEL
jgi:hypothetical protein